MCCDLYDVYLIWKWIIPLTISFYIALYDVHLTIRSCAQSIENDKLQQSLNDLFVLIMWIIFLLAVCFVLGIFKVLR